eukprot:12546814-Alexandrium_andersonii.AAC.1
MALAHHAGHSAVESTVKCVVGNNDPAMPQLSQQWEEATCNIEAMSRRLSFGKVDSVTKQDLGSGLTTAFCTKNSTARPALRTTDRSADNRVTV